MGFIDKFKEKKARFDNFTEAHRQKKLVGLKKKEKVLQSKLSVKNQRDKNQRLRGKLSSGGSSFLSVQPSGGFGSSTSLFGTPSKPPPMVKRRRSRKKSKKSSKKTAKRRVKRRKPPKTPQQPKESEPGFQFGQSSGQSRFG